MDVLLWLIGIVIAWFLLSHGHKVAGSLLLGMLAAIGLSALGSRKR